MRQLRITILLVLLALACSTYATDELTVGNISMAQGETATLSVELTNETTMIAFEFWMQLPEGITIAKDEEGDYAVTKNSTRLNRHDLAVALDADGRYHFLCYANPQKNIKNNEGELLSIELQCSDNVEDGSYQAVIENAIFSDADRVRHNLSDCPFLITVGSAMLGDVNKDKTVNVADVTALVNIILGKDNGETPMYDHEAANVNKDSTINFNDIAALMTIILAQ